MAGKNDSRLSDQEIADKLQAHLEAAMRLSTVASKRACQNADESSLWAGVVPEIGDAAGHVFQAHAAFTRAANAAPTIQPRFGGDGK